MPRPTPLLAVASLLALSSATPATALDTRLRAVDPSGPSALGNFRILCEFSHAAHDDPIVLPGQRGKAHYHFFFGNTLTDANSDTRSLRTSGASTCQGQTLNRSAYWIPAVFDADGTPQIPDVANFYYKNQAAEPASNIRLPQGLRMIAGNASGNADGGLLRASWRCQSWSFDGRNPSRVEMPRCAPGDGLSMNITFPECWNGRDLWLADRSHVAYAVWSNEKGGDLCPSSHSKVLPQISYQFLWKHPTESTAGWYLASDRHGGADRTPGSTLHGDWWNAWEPRVTDTWVQKCLHESRDCSTGNLGDGTALVREYRAGSGDLQKPMGARGEAWCNGRRATIVGTAGADTLKGTDGDDVVVAYGGDDVISTGDGRDVVCAGEGNDIVDTGAGDDEIRAGAGDDTVDAGPGRDRVHGDDGDDRLRGGRDRDSMYGGPGDDELNVDEGHDWAFGSAGRDVLYGSYFTDRLHGGPGDDELYGIGGANLLDGGTGRDVCEPGGENAIAVRRCP